MNAGYVIVGALVVVLLSIPVAWLVVLRLLKDDGMPVRASLEEDVDKGLGRAKGRSVAQPSNPEL
jgi:hypothetical protein